MKFNLMILLLVLWLSTFASCGARQKAVNSEETATQDYLDDGREKHANIEFEEDFVDLGTIKHGEIISYTFKFFNTGNIPLIIMTVNAGCGCTKTKLSKDLLSPSEEATLEVVFDSKGWYGSQFKSVTLVTNALTQKRSVTIKVNVLQ